MGQTSVSPYNCLSARSFDNCNPILYADDTEDLAIAQTKVNQDMLNVDHWLTQNIANVKKTKAMLIGSRQAANKADNIEIHLF